MEWYNPDIVVLDDSPEFNPYYGTVYQYRTEFTGPDGMEKSLADTIKTNLAQQDLSYLRVILYKEATGNKEFDELSRRYYDQYHYFLGVLYHRSPGLPAILAAPLIWKLLVGLAIAIISYLAVKQITESAIQYEWARVEEKKVEYEVAELKDTQIATAADLVQKGLLSGNDFKDIVNRISQVPPGGIAQIGDLLKWGLVGLAVVMILPPLIERFPAGRRIGARQRG